MFHAALPQPGIVGLPGIFMSWRRLFRRRTGESYEDEAAQALRSDLEERDRRIRLQEMELYRLRDLAGTLRAQIDRLEVTLAARGGRPGQSSAWQDHAELLRERDTFAATISDLRAAFGAQQRELVQLRAQRAALRQQARQSTDSPETRQRRKELETLRSELAGMQRRWTGLNHEHGNLTRQHQKLRRQKRALEDQLRGKG